MTRRHLEFRPLPPLYGGHVQTLAGTLLPAGAAPPSNTVEVPLDDGDRLAVEVSTPEGWRPEAGTVLMVHGLCSSHEAAYLVRLARKLWRRGVRAARMNMRGCGSGRGLARQLYHSGRSEDVFAAAEALREADGPPLHLVGFSLGGNQVLKLAGEVGDSGARVLAQVIAVCPPADLKRCATLLSRPTNRLYDQHFVRRLRATVAERHRLFPDLGDASLPGGLGLYEFDDLYTAPRSGFRDAEDYYRRSSAGPLVPAICVPCRILFAEDDPFIDPGVFDGVTLPPNVEVWHTRRGGHLGFVGRPGRPGGLRWLDATLLGWLGL